MLTAFSTGFMVSFGLILAIGAQNAFVLKQGLRNEHILPVIITCALSDSISILFGVSGFGLLVGMFPWIDPVMRYAGASFLLIYGARSFYSAFFANAALLPADAPAKSLGITLATCLAFTWLNPHFYLDTMVLIGTLSTRHPGSEHIFALGAISASFFFFFSLGYGARALRHTLSTRKSWQILESLIGVVMWVLAVQVVSQ